MTYQYVQFIAYQVNTVPSIRAGQTIKPGLLDQQQDIDARCELMLRAIQCAAAHHQEESLANAESVTLKVFMAPKFFFSGSTGAYDFAFIQATINRLQKMVMGREWTHWIFIFGSIVAFAPTNEDWEKGTFNFTLLHRGGAARPEQLDADAILFNLRSGIEHVSMATNESSVLLGARLRPFDGATGTRQVPSYNGCGVFPMSGITWALGPMPCAPNLRGQFLAQIQLAQLNGSEAARTSINRDISCIMLHCDGSGSGASNAHQADAAGLLPVATVPLDHEALQIPISPHKKIAIDQLCQRGPGDIAYYPVMAVPEPYRAQETTVQLKWPATKDYQFNFTLIYDCNGQYKKILCQTIAAGTMSIDSPSHPAKAARMPAHATSAHMRQAAGAQSAVFFRGNHYCIPLTLNVKDRIGQHFHIKMVDVPGSGARSGTGKYQRALWCQIDIPGFTFDGAAFEFCEHLESALPKTCWQGREA